MEAWQATVQDEAGNAVFNPQITVYESDGVTLASIYNEDGSPKGNPFTGSLEGFAQFWAGPGVYKIRGANVGQTELWESDLGGLGVAEEALDLAKAAFTFSGMFEQMISQMSDGLPVYLAAYGDSTTDGNNTTGWTANPTDGSGNAIGAAAHTPPNAWPAIAQSALRQMFDRSNISVWNAGYGGKAIVDGWAISNFNAAILENPEYGTPTAVFLNFGINDIRRAVYTPELMRSRLIELILAIRDAGSFPVFVTPDATSSDDDANPAVISGLIEVYKSVADLHGIKIIDTRSRQQDVWHARGDGTSRWVTAQGDGVHGNDNWHSLKGALIAASIFPNTLWADESPVVNIAPWSQHANAKGLSFNLNPINNVFGASMNITSSNYTAGQSLQRIWVWNACPDRDLYWHSVDGDGYYSPRPFANSPVIAVYDYLGKINLTRPSPTSGWIAPGGGHRMAEAPGYIGNLPIGLSRVLFNAPTDFVNQQVYLGYFSLRRPVRVSQAHIITHTGSGALGADYWADRQCPTLVGFGRGVTTNLFLHFSVPESAGIFLWSGRTFGGAATVGTNIRRGVMLFRNSDTLASLHNALLYGDGTASTTGGALASGTVTSAFWDDGRIRVSGSVVGSDQIIRIFSNWEETTPLMSVTVPTTAAPLPFGGSPGAVFAGPGVAGTLSATCDLVAVTYN